MPRQRQPLMGLGMLLLANKLLGTGVRHIPPVTLVAILIQAALFVGVINPPWDRYDVCISGESIWIYRDFRRLFLSAIEHADDFHLYYNMASFLIKGRSLEKKYGSLRYAIVLVLFTVCTSGVYIGLAKAAYMYFDDYSYMKQCAIGFSGVLFALKVLTTYESGVLEEYVHGLIVPAKLAVWIELVLIQILVPKVSFMGHLAGILVGVLYIQGPLWQLVDFIYNILSGRIFNNGDSYGYIPPQHRSYTYARGNSSSQHYGQNQNYGWNENAYGDGRFDDDEVRQRRRHYYEN